MLYEEGKFLLSDPVSMYLPEFKDVKVRDAQGQLVEARPMTIKHLLTHSAGLTYWTVPGWKRRFQEIGEMYNEAKLPFEETDAKSLQQWCHPARIAGRRASPFNSPIATLDKVAPKRHRGLIGVVQLERATRAVNRVLQELKRMS